MAVFDRDINAFTFRVKGLDQLVFSNDKYQATVVRAGKRLATMLRDRIDKQGKDHTGKKLPQVNRRSGWYWTGVYDPRFYGMPEFDTFVPYRGAERALVYWRGYKRLKAQMNGGRTWRGASLTGEMWKNFEIKFKAGRKGVGSVRFELHFTKGQRVGYHPTKKTKSGRPKSVYVRNRVKAQMLQYNHRFGDGEGLRGKPYGQAFVLMQPTSGEIGLMLQLIGTGIRFANSR